MTSPSTFSRRSALGTLLATVAPRVARGQSPTASPGATPPTFTWPEPVQLTDEISVLDWRLFPGEDAQRFIAEVHNSSSEVIVAPTIGAVLTNLPDSGNYGWGSPYTPVIYPGESTFIMGIAPTAVTSESDFEDAEWILCEPDGGASGLIDAVNKWDVEFTSDSVVHNEEWMECTIVLTNNSSQLLSRMALPGIVRDGTDRICGATPVPALNSIKPGETVEMKTNVRPGYPMLANPFNMITDITGGSAEFSLQSRGLAINTGCPPVMPWNR